MLELINSLFQIYSHNKVFLTDNHTLIPLSACVVEVSIFFLITRDYFLLGGDHPKPYAQCFFIILNILVFLFGGIILAFTILLLKSSYSTTSVKLFLIVISVLLLLIPLIGVLGSRFASSSFFLSVNDSPFQPDSVLKAKKPISHS